jgi:hypothetical protein
MSQKDQEAVSRSWGLYDYIKPPWRWKNLNEDEQALASHLLHGSRVAEPTANTVDAMVRAMIHPVMRGIYCVATTPAPYRTDAMLLEQVREDSGMIREIIRMAECSVKHEKWATLLCCDYSLVDKYIFYLRTTFEMSVQRTSAQAEFQELLAMDWAGDSEKMLDYRSAGLLVIMGIDPKSSEYRNRGAILAAELRERARARMSTVFIVNGTESVVVGKHNQIRSNVDNIVNGYFSQLGFTEADAIRDMMIGKNSHVFRLMTGANGAAVYHRLGRA